MRDEIDLAFGADSDLADGKAAAELDQPAVRLQCPRRRLAAASTATYMVKSVSIIMLAPEMVPPGRSVRGWKP